MKRLSGIEAALLRGCGWLMARGGRGGALLVLIYHRVLPAPDPLLWDEPDAAAFAAQMDVISATCNVLPLAEGVDRALSDSLPPRAVCITFDDGYANNCEIAVPILNARRLPATMFVATGFIGGGRMWNDTIIESIRCAADSLDLSDLGLGAHSCSDARARRQAIDAILRALKHQPETERQWKTQEVARRCGCGQPQRLMMSEAQIRQIAASGMEIGAHTVSHPILTRLDATTAGREIAASKADLEAIIGSPVTSFAYPNGSPHRDYDRSHVDLVRAVGFKAAVSTAWGAATAYCDRYQIPRVLPWDQSSLKFGLRLFRIYAERAAARV